MAQKKLQRFAELETFPNVLQFPENMAGNWKDHFSNPNPITLELACGIRRVSIGLAQGGDCRGAIAAAAQFRSFPPPDVPTQAPASKLGRRTSPNISGPLW